MRRKSRKLSEAETDVIKELPVKRSRTSSSQLEVENEHKRPKKLMVSVDFSNLGSNIPYQLRCGNKSSLVPSPSPSDPPPSIDKSPRKSPSIEQTITAINHGKETKFKSPDFCFSYLSSNRKKSWKSLKQILQAADKNSQWNPDMPTYSGIEAPPPLKPIKKYSDVSGLIAKYTDPLTGLYYSSKEEFDLIRTLSTSSVQSYLVLRGKATIS